MAPRPKGIGDDLAKIIAEAIQAAKGLIPEAAKSVEKVVVEKAPTVRSVAAAAVESSGVAKKLAEVRAARIAGSIDDAAYLDELLNIRAAKGLLTKEERRTINIAQNKALQDSKKTGGAMADERMKANLAEKKLKSDKSKAEMKKYGDIKFTGKERYDVAAEALRKELDSTMNIIENSDRKVAGFNIGYEKAGNDIVDAAVSELNAARKAGMKVTSPEYGELVRNAKQKLAKWSDEVTQAAKVGESRNKGLETRLGNLSKMTDQEVIDAGVRQHLWSDEVSLAEIRRVRNMTDQEYRYWRAKTMRDAKRVSKPTGKPFPTGGGGDKPTKPALSAAEIAEKRIEKMAKKSGITVEEAKKIDAAERAARMKARDKMTAPNVDSLDVLKSGEASYKIVDKKVPKVDGKDNFVEATARQRNAAIKRTEALRRKDAKAAKLRLAEDSKYNKMDKQIRARREKQDIAKAKIEALRIKNLKK